MSLYDGERRAKQGKIRQHPRKFPADNPAHMASVVPYGAGYRCHAEWHGRKASKTFKSKREAVQWGVLKEREMAAQGEYGWMTFSQACEKYLATVSTRKFKSAATWERRRLAAAAIYFGADTPLGSIDSAKAGQWRDSRLQTVSGSTVIREGNLIRNLFTVAVDEWKALERNPFAKLRMPEHDPPRDVVWTWQLIRRVLSADRTGKTAEVIRAFHIGLHTGRRLSEIVTGTYHPGRKVFELASSKTSRRREFFPVPSRAVKLLPFTFTVGANEASTLFSKLIRHQLGIDHLTFHDTRATALTLLARRVDVMTLARISGHRDLKMLFNTYYRESAEQISSRI